MKRLSSGGLLALTALLLAGCPKAPEPKDYPPPPTIKSFTADKARVELGESVTLTFEAQNATEAVILDGSGKEVAYEGDANGGTATVTPEKTDVYVLKVTGEGGRDTDFTRVAVGEDLKEVFLTAVPPEVKAGQPVDLIWSAQRAKTVSITSSGDATVPAIDPADGSGVVTVVPARSQTFTLSATGADIQAPLTAETEVVVQAALVSFNAKPAGAEVGETITLHWTTQGADEVILSEALFGEQKRVTAATELQEVDDGSFDFVVPETLPSGAAVSDGQPLHFTLTVKQTSPERTITRELAAYVGANPVIEAFVTPEAISEGKPVTISWKTGNATKVQVFSNGQMVFETLPGDQARVTAGSYDLPTIGQDLNLRLVALNHAGGTAEETRIVALVKMPKILTFNVPMTVATAGDPVNATWTTQDATEVIIRPLAGPTLFHTSEIARVLAGSEDLYPSNTTTLVLEAYNAAGDSVTAEQVVQVFTPSDVSASPSPALPGTTVTLAWNLDPSTTAQVIGVPSATPINDPNATDWLELDGHVDAREVQFASPDDAIAPVPLSQPFHFPFVDGVRDEIWVSTNGFIAFEDVGPLPDNADLTDPTTAEVIAPMWDDLVLGSGKVLAVVDDSVTPRRLVIQWDGVATQSDPNASLTFQVQLEESGRFRFVYEQLSGTDSGGDSATIGVKVRDGLFDAQLAYNTGGAVVASNSQSTWFGSGSINGSMDLTLTRTALLGFFSRQQGGRYLFHSAPVWVFAPGSLLITEAMPAPGAGVTAGHWFELYNAQAVPVDVGGIELTTTSASQPLVLPSTIIPAHTFVVVGEDGDMLQNGGVDVDIVWPELINLQSADTVQAQLLGSVISSMTWSTATQGTSVVAETEAIDATGAGLSCPRTETFGAGFFGTPGAPNESCFEYSLTPIPGAFEDISAIGTDILASESDYTGIGTFTLPAPFPYFGEVQTDVNISMVGFITFGPPLTEAFDVTNDDTPGSPEPNGVVAPFWDRLVRNTNGHIWMARRPSYTVISWQDFRIYATTSSLDFQVKLFDSGVIEFHYGTLTPITSGTYADYHSGKSATTWIERLDGSAALPININTAGGIQPNTGYRFVPNP